MPRRVSTAQVDSTASCRLHVDTTLATRDYGNEALRKRFTCVVAYPFVRRDSRTSVAHPLARPSDRLRRGSLRKAFAFLRCISARPAFLTVCRLLYSADSFHSASPAEFCSAYVSLVSSLSVPFYDWLTLSFPDKAPVRRLSGGRQGRNRRHPARLGRPSPRSRRRSQRTRQAP